MRYGDFDDPATIAAASDELTPAEAAGVIARVIGVDLEPQQAALEELGPRAARFLQLARPVGHNVDIDALRHDCPEVGWHSYRAWITTQRPRLREVSPHDHPVAR